jgi:hypothetical protein
MPSVVRYSLLAACGVFGLPLVASAQYGKVEGVDVMTPVATPYVSSGTILLDSSDLAPATTPFGPPGMYPGSYGTRGTRLPVPTTRSRSSQTPQWTIPVGEYGLELADGTRMVGRPAKNWTARIATGFGTVTIPLAQIAHIAPAGKGQFAAYLKNGDRVSGSLVSNSMKFETRFGTLSVAAADIARLRSSGAGAAQPVTGAVSRSSNIRPGDRTSNRTLIGPTPVPPPTRFFPSFRRPRPK